MGDNESQYLLVLLLLAAGARGQTSADVCGAWTGTSTGTQRIVGGTAASIPMPWMAVLHPVGTHPSSAICGATLITNRHIVTAAHCMRALEEDKLRPAITLGVLNRCLRREATRQALTVAKAVTHPQYTSEGGLHDIALLTAKEEAEARFIPACLPPALDEGRKTIFGWLPNNNNNNNIQDEGRWALVAGFGQTREGVESSASCTLRCAGVRVFTDSECARTSLPRNYATAPSLLCAGVTGGGVDSCQGDSGGGLIATEDNAACKNYIIGVVAFGFGCGQARAPGLYTRVASYVPWLHRQMGLTRSSSTSSSIGDGSSGDEPSGDEPSGDGSSGSSGVASSTAAPPASQPPQRPPSSSGGRPAPQPPRQPRPPVFVIFRRDGRAGNRG